MPASNNLQFSQDDLKTPDRIEWVLRQIIDESNANIQSAVSSIAGASPASLAQLVTQLAPLIRNSLQATGSTPLNTQSLLPAAGNAASVQEDTHANRINVYTPPSTVGSVFYETDRNILYVAESSGTLFWHYSGGVYCSSFANRPADLTTTDAGLLFYATDTFTAWTWSGTAWITTGGIDQTVIDSVTNNVTNVLILQHLLNNLAGANGMAVGLLSQLVDSTKATVDVSRVETIITNVTAATFTTEWIVQLRSAGAALADWFRVLVTGISFKVGGFFGIFTHANSADRTYTFPDKDTTFDWGTYAPVLFNDTNLTASSAYICQWQRIGSIVTVSGKVNMTPTATAAYTQLRMSIPVSSNFSDARQCGGTASSLAGASAPNQSVLIGADLTHIAVFAFNATDSTPEDYFFVFMYLIV